MADLRAHGPSVNADVIDMVEQRRRNALFALDVLVRAYVPKSTNDWREGLAALEVLRAAPGVSGTGDPTFSRDTPMGTPKC